VFVDYQSANCYILTQYQIAKYCKGNIKCTAGGVAALETIMVVSSGYSATFTLNIEEVCVSRRKSLRGVWRLPYKTHCYLLPLLSQ